MYHMFWECLVIDLFWTQVCCDLEKKLTGCNFTPFPCLCLLNDDSSLNLGAMDKMILFFFFWQDLLQQRRQYLNFGTYIKTVVIEYAPYSEYGMLFSYV